MAGERVIERDHIYEIQNSLLKIAFKLLPRQAHMPNPWFCASH